MAASATAHPHKPAAKPRVWLPILPAAYTKSLIQPRKLIAVLPNPASHSFWTKLGDSIKAERVRVREELASAHAEAKDLREVEFATQTDALRRQVDELRRKLEAGGEQQRGEVCSSSLGPVNTREGIEDEGEVDAGEKHPVELVVAGANPPVALEPAQEALDLVAAAGSHPVVLPGFHPVGVGRHHGHQA